MPTGDIYHEGQSFFDASPGMSLLPLQVEPTAPQVTGLESASGMAIPDQVIRARLKHFPEDLYDLRDTSHLMRLMKALLGESGAGQLRKRYLISQFQGAMKGTHFYDLDRFYGSIFGISRTVGELLGVNPAIDTATQNEWDQIEDSDASFRDRIFHLASAINLGATYPGLQAAAEALTQVDCDVYEVWDLLDTYGPGGPGRTWDAIEDLDPDSGLPTWDGVEDMDASDAHPSWVELEDATTIGRTSTNSRAEVIVVPKKDYDRLAVEVGEEEAARQRLEDEHSLIRVLNVLKPASVLLTVDPDGLAIHKDAAISALQADSNFWSIATRVAPRPGLVAPNGTPYPRSLQQVLQGILESDKREIPKPPWSIRQAARWSYAPEVVAVRGYTFRADPVDPVVRTVTTEIAGENTRRTLRVATYNFGDGTNSSKSADLENLATVADVILCEEVGDRESVLNGLAGFSVHQGDSDGRSKVAVLVRHGIRIKDRGYWKCHDETFVGDAGAGPETISTKWIAWVQVEFGGVNVTLGATHKVPSVQREPFPGRELRRELYAQHIQADLAWMRNFIGQGPVLLGGDFNATPEYFQLQPLRDAGMVLRTQDSHGARAIDHLWTRGSAIDPQAVEALSGFSSDHRPVVGTYLVGTGPGSTTVTETITTNAYTIPGTGPIVDRRTDDVVAYRDGTQERFTADRGVLDPRRALAARYASEGLLVSAPYSGDREANQTSG